MLRFIELPPNRPDVEPTRTECIAMAFHCARFAPLEADKARAMHVACSWLEKGLFWLD